MKELILIWVVNKGLYFQLFKVYFVHIIIMLVVSIMRVCSSVLLTTYHASMQPNVLASKIHYHLIASS